MQSKVYICMYSIAEIQMFITTLLGKNCMGQAAEKTLQCTAKLHNTLLYAEHDALGKPLQQKKKTV